MGSSQQTFTKFRHTITRTKSDFLFDHLKERKGTRKNNKKEIVEQ